MAAAGGRGQLDVQNLVQLLRYIGYLRAMYTVELCQARLVKIYILLHQSLYLTSLKISVYLIKILKLVKLIITGKH